MSNYPLVSVVIPTYGRSNLLNRAIDSVLDQTYNNIEIIVVDDNNPDSKHREYTENLLQKYIENHEILYIKHQKNSGGSAARNTGIKLSKGEYIALLDDDDEWFSHKLEQQISYFESLNTNVGVIYCSYILQEYDGSKEYIRTEKGDLTKDLLMLQFDPGASSTLVFRKNILEKIGYFDESFERHQDLEILIRLCRTHLIDVCSVVLLKINGHNFPSAAKIENVKKHFFNTFKSDIAKLTFWDQKKVYAQHYIELSSLFFTERDFSKMIKYYIIAILNYPSMFFTNRINRRVINYVKKQVKVL